jgi:hypothetical protein
MTLAACEFIVLALYSWLWLWFFGGAVFRLSQGLPIGVLVFACLSGLGLLAGWCAHFIKDFARVPRGVRVLVAAGLCAGLGAIVVGLFAGSRGVSIQGVVSVGLVLIPGCRHLLRVLPWLRKQPVAS